VIFYHAVADSPLPHVDALYRGRTKREFEADLDYLLREFQPITLAELRSVITGASACPKRAFLVTFDDGLRETTETVVPILRAHGLETVFFVSSGFMDNIDLSYRFKANLLVKRLRENPGTTADRNQVELLLPRTNEGRPVSLEQRLLQIKYAERAVLDCAAELLDFSFADYLTARQPYLGRDDVVNLSKSGFHVGAHSVDHPPYSALTVAEQLAQTRESCSVIADLTRTQRTHFAFPFSERGVSSIFYATLLKEHTVDLFFGTCGWRHNAQRRLVSRVSFEGNRREPATHLRETMARTILDGVRSAFANRRTPS
jgi:peptidoglycan/xylan/chitin deacetylase (PgdA/CDA1 family)